jgi:2-dehydro-3-deoxygluconokinase
MTDRTIACIGECMVEFRQLEDGRFASGFGGDTLNTAVYLSRLGARVDYITALGNDDWSDAMLDTWRQEGVGVERVLRIAGAMPGLYVIQLDEHGERRFSYWRDQSAARRIFAMDQTPQLVESLKGYGTLYLSGISLSLYGEAGRATLLAGLDAAKRAGAKIVFDTNYRPRGWPVRDEAVAAFAAALDLADMVFASMEDLEPLFGPEAMQRLALLSRKAECVIKEPGLSVTVLTPNGSCTVRGQPAEKVVDTTAAGDSFAAAYMAARLTGAGPEAAAAAGHALARRVVGHYGALIPKDDRP